MQTQYLKLADGTIAFDDQGEGPLILAVPAGGDLRSEYRFLTPRLVASGYRVATMDVRGQGESSAYWPDYTFAALGSDMLALIRHLKAGPALIIGTSKAAGAAVWASVQEPDLVNGLVLVSSGTPSTGSSLQARLTAGFFLSPLWGTAVYSSYFPKMYPTARPADFAAHLEKVRAMLKEPGRLRALRLLFSENGAAWDARLSKVQTPVLILTGSRDPDFKQPEQQARRLAERLTATRATVQMIEGAGHHPQAEMPEQVAESILDFLAAKKQKRVLA